MIGLRSIVSLGQQREFRYALFGAWRAGYTFPMLGLKESLDAFYQTCTHRGRLRASNDSRIHDGV